MDTSKTEVVLLRNQTKSLDHLINVIKQSLDAKILRKNGEPKNNRLHRQKGVHFTKDGFYKSKDELSFNDLKSAVTDYNIFISKHGTKDRQINIDVLSENEPIYNVLVDILNQIQLQIANNENALLNHWG